MAESRALKFFLQRETILFEFRHDLWHQKTRVMGLSCGVACVILRLAILIQYWSVTDTHTHTHTDTQTHDDGI